MGWDIRTVVCLCSHISLWKAYIYEWPFVCSMPYCICEQKHGPLQLWYSKPSVHEINAILCVLGANVCVCEMRTYVHKPLDGILMNARSHITLPYYFCLCIDLCVWRDVFGCATILPSGIHERKFVNSRPSYMHLGQMDTCATYECPSMSPWMAYLRTHVCVSMPYCLCLCIATCVCIYVYEFRLGSKVVWMNARSWTPHHHVSEPLLQMRAPRFYEQMNEVYVVGAGWHVQGECTLTHEKMTWAHSIGSLERTLDVCCQQKLCFGGKTLSIFLGWFKIPWMLFKKRIHAAYFDLTICHSIHAEHKWRYV